MKPFAICLLAVLVSSCAPGGGGTTTGNPITVPMSFEPYNASLAANRNAAAAQVSSLELCFKRMRLKLEDGSVGGNLDLELGQVLVKAEGTPLGSAEIAEGSYKRVELDLEKECEGGSRPSVRVTNGNGTFTTTDRITIKFEGLFDPSKENLDMAIQNIVDQAKLIGSDEEIRDKLEAVSGELPRP